MTAPERIRVAQDADGFWTCREAISGSQEYVRADIYEAALSVQPAAAVVGETERDAMRRRIYADLAKEGGGTWATYVCMDIVALEDAAFEAGKEAAPSAPDDEPECEFGVPEPKFRVGQLVEKSSGYKWPGVVVSRFLTQSMQIRYVVECTVPEVAGALHIYSETQLVALRSEKP